MKKLLALSLGALCAASFAANCANANANASNWSGAYAGVQAGGEWATASGPFTNADGSSPLPYSNSPSGGLLGVRTGYNWRNGDLVFGVEGDANAALGVQSGSFLPVSKTSYVVQSKQTWNADIRGRLGYAIDKTLVYGAAGLAFGDVHTFYGGAGYAPPGGTPFAVTTQRVGWTVGAGVERAFSDKIVGSLEYRYTDLGSRSFSNSNPLIDTADNVKYHSSSVLVGLAYRF